MAAQTTNTAWKPFYRNRASREDPLKKQRVLCLRLRDDDYDLISMRADECGLTKSEYVRQLVLGYEPKAMLTKEQVTLLQDVSKVRYELQQMSNFFSRDKSATWPETQRLLRNVIAKLKSILNL